MLLPLLLLLQGSRDFLKSDRVSVSLFVDAFRLSLARLASFSRFAFCPLIANWASSDPGTTGVLFPAKHYLRGLLSSLIHEYRRLSRRGTRQRQLPSRTLRLAVHICKHVQGGVGTASRCSNIHFPAAYEYGEAPKAIFDPSDTYSVHRLPGSSIRDSFARTLEFCSSRIPHTCTMTILSI